MLLLSAEGVCYHGRIALVGEVLMPYVVRGTSVRRQLER
ncbi:hypothetical protein GA0074692_1146 [Micromonospora pallida]|uniref:Uncharacterized protein n=1 Tax=Micromonospora pallida TaxID=145854 RepID=A0A1C6RVR9_9ACTN|nr:hypothetical protein GA0074692_1146 [Micromonospora pallida]